MWSYKKICKFSKEVFDYFNGRVNKILKVDDIIFLPEKKIKIYNGPIEEIIKSKLGFIELNKIFFYSSEIDRLYNVSKDIFGYNMSDSHIKGIIIHAIVHELMHADQDIDFLKIEDDVEWYKLEIANEILTNNYLLNNRKEIENTFGEIDFSIESSLYLNKKEELKLTDDDIKYIRIKTPKDKLFKYLNSILLIDIEKLFEYGLSNGLEKYYFVIIKGTKAYSFISDINILLSDIDTQYNLMSIITDYLLAHNSYLTTVFILDKAIQFEFIKIGFTENTIQIYPTLTSYPRTKELKPFIIKPKKFNIIDDWNPFIR